MSDNGLTSRRQADEWIADGRVSVNGKKVYELGVKIDPNLDKVIVDGKPLKVSNFEKLYLAFNKPKGVLTTMEDPLGRPTVAQFLDHVPARVFPVGRLDWDSEGLILMTNDGDFANKVMHPKSEITKTYLVKLDGHPEARHIQKLMNGVTIVGGKVRARHVEKIKRTEGSDKYDWYKIVITEGKNRQIRQMFEKVGFDVMKLQRVAIGRLKLGPLGRGEVAFLHESLLERIFEADEPDKQKVKNTYKGMARSKKQAPAGRQPKPGKPTQRGERPKKSAAGPKRTARPKSSARPMSSARPKKNSE
jgi:23S rRNA pseudouridine2605 synthase